MEIPDFVLLLPREERIRCYAEIVEEELFVFDFLEVTWYYFQSEESIRDLLKDVEDKSLYLRERLRGLKDKSVRRKIKHLNFLSDKLVQITNVICCKKKVLLKFPSYLKVLTNKKDMCEKCIFCVKQSLILVFERLNIRWKIIFKDLELR